MEYMESMEQCVCREVEEETGIKIKNIRFLFVMNLKKYPPKHYVHVGFVADWESGEASVREPEKCESWAWCALDDIPEPLFEATRVSIDAYLTGKNYYDN